ncbi:helix-turn-helix transcriptional regulator [Aeromicrobium fastidiosum]|nr:transcriptional regulator [Aeromicrobium fastidiosum]MBP2392122.1 putative ArsR family transcriptional regulator [Aeromicrobium fastidiosum]
MKYVQPMEKVSVDDAPTRTRVSQTILENGPSTAADLAEQLGLTAAAVRRHLDHLIDEGVVEARDQRITGQRGRGRPAKVFAITDAGRDGFEHAYDELAAGALRYLAETGGDAAVMAFARHRLVDLEDRYRPMLQLADVAQRPRVLAEALSNDGFAASVSTTPAGAQICQHHCPVAHVAEEFPQMCEAEAEMFSRLLGSHVQRLATIAHGDGVCTTHLPHSTETTRTPTAERLPS